MNYADSIQAFIGETPMLWLNHLDAPEGAGLFAKLELFNPAGSVKDRVGQYTVAEKSGRLLPGGTFVEATADNTGIGIAVAALNKGYRVIFMVPGKFSMEKQAVMKALGAEIVFTPREGGMQQAAQAAQAPSEGSCAI